MKPQEELALLLQADDKNWSCGDCGALNETACIKAKQSRMDEKTYRKICGRDIIKCELCPEMEGVCDKTGLKKRASQKACQAKDVKRRHDFCDEDRNHGWKCACRQCQTCYDPNEDESICDYCSEPTPEECDQATRRAIEELHNPKVDEEED